MHAGILNRCDWMDRCFPFFEDGVVCFHTAPTFVDSVWQMLGPLLAGATCLVLAPETSRDPMALLKALVSRRASHFVAVPTLLRILVPVMQRVNAKGGFLPPNTTLCAACVVNMLVCELSPYAQRLQVHHRWHPLDAASAESLTC